MNQVHEAHFMTDKNTRVLACVLNGNFTLIETDLATKDSTLVEVVQDPSYITKVVVEGNTIRYTEHGQSEVADLSLLDQIQFLATISRSHSKNFNRITLTPVQYLHLVNEAQPFGFLELKAGYMEILTCNGPTEVWWDSKKTDDSLVLTRNV